MKSIFQKLILLTLTLSIIGCEDVVDIKLDDEAPKIVIDAGLVWNNNSDGKEQSITITTTSSYFETTPPPKVSNATVNIVNSKGDQFDFNESSNESGQYICTDFKPEINETYTLNVIANNVNYSATEKLLATPAIDSTVSSIETGILEKERIDTRIYFQDDPKEKNYYLFSVKPENELLFEHGVNDDLLADENGSLFGLYISEEIKTGDLLHIRHTAISKNYHNYLAILLSIAGNESGGPFSTAPTSVKGNIINNNDSSDNPLGYFRILQINSINDYEITIKEANKNN